MVPFPFDDLSTTKARPAVCLTDPIGNYQHVILAFISSRTEDVAGTDVKIDSNDPDFKTTGLKVSSVIRLHRMMTVTASLVKRELGELSPRMTTKVSDKLKELFKLG